MADGNVPLVAEEFTPDSPEKELLARKIATTFLMFNSHYNPSTKEEIDTGLTYLAENRPEIRDNMEEIFDNDDVDMEEEGDEIYSFAKDYILLHMHRKLMAEAEIDYTDLDNAEIDEDAARRRPYIRCLLAKFELFIEYINYRVGNSQEENAPTLREYNRPLYKKIYNRCVKKQQTGSSRKRSYRIGYIRKRW